jgi:hypothetical protein
MVLALTPVTFFNLGAGLFSLVSISVSCIQWGKLRAVLWDLFAERRRLKLFSILPKRLEANEKQTEDNQCDKYCFFSCLFLLSLFSAIFLRFFFLQ